MRIDCYSGLTGILDPSGPPLLPWGMPSSHEPGPLARLPLPMTPENKQTRFAA